MDYRAAARSDLSYQREKLFLPPRHGQGARTHLKRQALLCGLLSSALLACGDNLPTLPGGSDTAGAALDERAIQAGILPDPEKSELAGRFETRGDLGVDKFCAVKKSATEYDVGFMSVSGAESKCEATGTATVNGEEVKISLAGQGECSFVGRFDGIELRFPAVVDDRCAQYCSDRTSFSGTHYFMIEPGNNAGRGTLGRDIEKLCQ